jgi:hypothetical protein
MKTFGSKTIRGLCLSLFTASCFLFGCNNQNHDLNAIRISDDVESNISDTTGFFKNVSYSNTGGAATNYDFGYAWDSLGYGEEKKRRLDSLEVIGFYEETSGVIHEQDTSSFCNMIRELLKGSTLSTETKTSLQKQLSSDYMAKTLFVGGRGCAVRNYMVGDEDEYISFRFYLCTTTALTPISKGTITLSTSTQSVTNNATNSVTNSVAMPKNILAGKLGFKGIFRHVKPGNEERPLPAGYHKVNHRGLDIEDAFMLYDTSTVAGSSTAILCFKN